MFVTLTMPVEVVERKAMASDIPDMWNPMLTVKSDSSSTTNRWLTRLGVFVSGRSKELLLVTDETFDVLRFKRLTRPCPLQSLKRPGMVHRLPVQFFLAGPTLD